MSDSDARRATPDGEGPRPLRTTPRPPLVHWLVDSAVVFLALILVGLFLGAPWWGVARRASESLTRWATACRS